MKRVSIILSVTLMALIAFNLHGVAANPKAAHAKHAFKHKRSEGSPLLFWTDKCSYGPIQIFVNDVYQGEITKCYASVPQCAAEGCVTVMIYGDNNVWTAQSRDGRHKWASKRVRLEAKDCNSECLL